VEVVLVLLTVVAVVTFLVVGQLLRARKGKPVRVIAEAAPPPATISGEVDPMGAIDALLAELERATVRIDGADELDESAVAELERLADQLEAAAAGLERVA
jgi:hypothetical protein